MDTRQVFSVLIALALALLLFTPTGFAAPEDPLTIVADGVQIVTSDVIIDIGKTDIIYIITAREEQPVVPLDGDVLDAYVARTTPLERPIRVRDRAELVRENVRRQIEFRSTARTIKEAPRGIDLPPFVVSRDIVQLAASSGQTYPRGFRTVDTIKNPAYSVQPEDSFYHLVIRDDPFYIKRGRNITVILAYKENEQHGIEGKRVGNLLFVEGLADSIIDLPASERQKLSWVAPDLPIQTMLTDVQLLTEAAAVRLSEGISGAVGICLVDSGLDYTQPAFTQNYVGGYDFVNNDTDPSDGANHGTLMAYGVLDIAPGGQLYVAKVLDSTGSGLVSTAIQGIDWCMQQDVSVIMMSFGTGYYDGWCDEVSVLAMKANEAAARGFTVVAATGNNGGDVMASPACGSLVTSVGASTKDDERAAISNTNELTDVFAPGQNISVPNGQGFGIVSGTSIANAITAGAAALLIETGIDPASVHYTFRSTGVVINSSTSGGTPLQIPRISVGRAVRNETNSLNTTQNGFQSTKTLDSATGAFICVDIGSPCPGGDGDCNPFDVCDGQDNCNLNCNTIDYIDDTCDYDPGTWAVCSGNCNDYCTDGVGCTNAPAGVSGASCGSGVTCSGQNRIDNNLCTGAGSCGQTLSTCGGNCDSYCSSGVCQNTAAGADPYSICSAGTYCVGDAITDGDVCGSGTSCGYSTVSCATPTFSCVGAGVCKTNNGYACSISGDCVSNLCKQNVYQGGPTAYHCAGDNSWCVGTSSSYVSGSTVGDSTCRGSVSGGSVWLASAGRYQVQTTGGTVLAVIDKYGSMGVRGTVTYSTGSFDSGWQVTSAGTTRLSVNSANGNLRAAGTLTPRTVPSGTGFRVQDTGGTLQGIITTTGNILIRGDLAYSLTTLS